MKPEEVTELFGELEHLSSENRLSELKQFNLEKGRLQRETSWALSILKGGL